MASAAAATPKADKPFTPPTPRHLAEHLKPEDCEAQDVAEKILRDRLPDPVGFTVNHDFVGPWPKGARVSVREVHEHLNDKDRRVDDPAKRQECVDRLVSLNALVPHFE